MKGKPQVESSVGLLSLWRGSQNRARVCAPQVLILELRSLSPAVFRAAVLGAGESFGTVPVTCGMGFFQMAPEGGAGEAGGRRVGSGRVVRWFGGGGGWGGWGKVVGRSGVAYFLAWLGGLIFRQGRGLSRKWGWPGR